MDKGRQATFTEGRMVPRDFDDRFGLAFCAVHGSMIRAAKGRLQLPIFGDMP
jgi:hypothetical protein